MVGSYTTGQANMQKVHTAEIYLTIQSAKEVYKKNKAIRIINHEGGTYGNTQTFNDKYHRETFFISVHTRKKFIKNRGKMKNRFNKNERGFALPLALLLLVVMTIMGTTLVTITSGEHKANTNKDISQQTFYAAESGITIAKTWIVETSSSKTLSPGGSPGITFCKTNFFPNLNQGSIKAINNPATNRAHVGRNTLNNVITGTSPDEQGTD